MRNVGAAVIASLFLGAVMALGDYAWAAMHLEHRVAYGLAHGAVMCLCLGIAIGVHARRPAPAALAGPVIGIVAAATFYVLAPLLRMAAMFPAWMLFWILFALLQQRLMKGERVVASAARGPPAAILSVLPFSPISRIWTGPPHHQPTPPVPVAAAHSHVPLAVSVP